MTGGPQNPKRVVPLTDLQVRNAKKRDRPYKLADGGGLYLEVTVTGSKLWRMKFRQRNWHRTNLKKWQPQTAENILHRFVTAERREASCSGSHFKPTVLAFDADFGSN
jgi:hypothetical protein